LDADLKGKLLKYVSDEEEDNYEEDEEEDVGADIAADSLASNPGQKQSTSYEAHKVRELNTKVVEQDKTINFQKAKIAALQSELEETLGLVA